MMLLKLFRKSLLKHRHIANAFVQVHCKYLYLIYAGSLVWVGYRGQRSWREEWAEFAGSRFFVAFDRDSLPKQVSLLTG